MPLLQLQNKMEADIMTIPGVFIDYYLPAASGEDVRVFLFLLRNLTGPDADPDICAAELAERLDISERDLLRSLSYWEETGLVKLTFSSKRQLESILFLDIVRAAKEELGTDKSGEVRHDTSVGREAAERLLLGGTKSVPDAGTKNTRPYQTARDASSQTEAGRNKKGNAAKQPADPVSEPLPDERELTEASFDPDFLAASFMLQSLIGREITPAETRRFCIWYLRLGRSQDTMEQLLIECRNNASQGDPTFEDVDRTAAAWYRLSGAAQAFGTPAGPDAPADQPGKTVPGPNLQEPYGAPAPSRAEAEAAQPAASDRNPDPAAQPLSGTGGPGLSPVPSAQTSSEAASEGSADSPVSRNPRIPSRSEMAALDADNEFQALALMTETCLSRPLSGADTELLGYWYINFGHSADIIESLIDYCLTACSPRKPNMKYLDSVAVTWFTNGISSAAQAREYSRLHNKTINTVLKALGFGPRNPRDVTDSEEQMIREWVNDCKMPLELIKAACERATAQTNGNRFHYANSIIRDWDQKGIRTLEDVRKENAEHFEKNKSRPQVKLSENAQNAHNFHERDTDYEARILERIRENKPT